MPDQMKGKILVAGGAGYIGSHTCVELLENNYEIIIVDNFLNCSPIVLERIKQITKNSKPFQFFNINLAQDLKGIQKIFQENNISTVINFAGLKAVGESIDIPLDYYENNLRCLFNLLRAMESSSTKICSNFIFSSSATVYGQPERVPIEEGDRVDGFSITNPYGRTKYFIEEILRDYGISRQKQNKP